MLKYSWSAIFCLAILSIPETWSQNFYFGADQSYVNELEDCGAIYYENNQPKDIHSIFADHGCNIVRLRLWHTPAWYDALNDGKRYSNLQDVQKSMARVRAKGMQVLLNFHLSDNWADPSKQIIPQAWEGIADNLPVLEDSLFAYIHHTLMALYQEDLLPEMVQIGNETNRGILLTREQNQNWTLDWDRNSRLFNAAIRAIHEVERASNKDILVALHFAAPAEIEWYIEESVANGIRDFDIIAMSYYWAWHMPTTISETGAVIKRLKEKYRDKDVVVVETGYPWTLANNDAAPNIISEVDDNYAPISPESQKKWLIDLTQEVINNGGSGVFYWEPSWVSTSCWNQWNQGSHQDHATFFDFDNNLQIPGGIEFMQHEYDNLLTSEIFTTLNDVSIHVIDGSIEIDIPNADNSFQLTIFDTIGQIVLSEPIKQSNTIVSTSNINKGVYIIVLQAPSGETFRKKVLLY